MPHMRKIDKSEYDALPDVEPLAPGREHVFVCPDCAAEGKTEAQPLSAFYVFHASRYRNERKRSTICRVHWNKRRNDRLAAQLDPTSADYNPQLHAAQKLAKRKYGARRSPKSPNYDPKLHERQLAHRRALRDPKHPDYDPARHEQLKAEARERAARRKERAE